MEIDELTVVVTALHEQSLVLAGKIVAMETVTEALLATVGTALPPLLPQLQAHLGALAQLNRSRLDGDTQLAFDSHIWQIKGNLQTLQGS